jgi:hypothetical protein
MQVDELLRWGPVVRLFSDLWLRLPVGDGASGMGLVLELHRAEAYLELAGMDGLELGSTA